MPNLFKDLAFDGTMYHLWYLPASMIGMIIAWYLVKRLDFQRGLAVAAALYLIGLLGDSYYKIAEELPLIKTFYGLLFEVFDYTRNGIFFAPIFLLLGGFIADKKQRLTISQASVGFTISFVVMFFEAIILHQKNFPRHDSMYLLLPVCMFFLFYIILHFRGKQIRNLRIVSLLIYLIHPMVIIAVRVVAKIMHFQKLLIHNNFVHFIVTCAVSILLSFAIAVLWERLVEKKKHDIKTDRAYIEINLENLTHNAEVLQAAMPQKCQLMAVVKAEAYGHSAFIISTHLEKQGVKAFAVATIDEGIKLRRYGIRGEILILGYTDVRRAEDLKKYHLTQTLVDFDYAARLNRQAIPVNVHIGIDSGMHRLGFSDDDFIGIRNVFQMKYLKVKGIFTHLCCSDSLQTEDVIFTKGQISRFYGVIDKLKKSGIRVPKLHIQSSYGLLNYPELHCDYVRAGISLYGISSMPNEQTVLKLDLRPVLSLKAKVILIRKVLKGEYVGYGRTFQAERDSRIAILSIGYGDGFPRTLSCGKASVRIGGHIVPVIGRICMDQLAIDITDAAHVVVGDTATLIDKEENVALSAPNVADSSGSISNELLSRMGARLPIVIQTGN